jgi:hypothetical protein
MSARDQIEVVEEQITEEQRTDIELSLSDLDLVGGGSLGHVFV